MFLFYLLVWIIFNGVFTWEVLGFGIIISAAIYFFSCKFMGFSIQKDKMFVRLSGHIIVYLAILAWEIVKANFCVIGLIFSSKKEVEPALVHFTAPLHTPFGRLLLANSITLTPGTITVSQELSEYQVHCLDKDLGIGLDQSVFVERIQKMEAVIDQYTTEKEGE